MPAGIRYQSASFSLGKVGDELSRALKAWSTLYRLATNTALTTFASVSGNASMSVASAWACGLIGRGGFGGGASSSSTLGCSFDVSVVDLGLAVDESWASFSSSSKSSGCAVVGDSALCVCSGQHERMVFVGEVKTDGLLCSRFLRHYML